MQQKVLDDCYTRWFIICPECEAKEELIIRDGDWLMCSVCNYRWREYKDD